MHVFGVPRVVWGAFWKLRTTLNAPKGPLKTSKRHFAKTLVKHMVFGHFGEPLRVENQGKHTFLCFDIRQNGFENARALEK